jgi:GT2 family glycosyltransferase
MSAPALDIIIVNWNTRDLLARTLACVEATVCTPYTCWVVDNGSSDDSVAYVREHFPWVQLIANSDNLGFAAANNQAILEARGRYALLLNSDTEAQPGAIDRLVAYMEANPEVGACGPKLLNADRSLQPSARNFYSTFGSLVENKLIAQFWKQPSSQTRFLSYWDHSYTRPVDWVTGACLLARMDAIRRVGLLDTAFFMYGEEIDWQMRMQKAGYPVHFVHDAEVIHLGGGSSRNAFQKMRHQEYLSRQILIDKHYPPHTRAVFRVKTAVGIGFWKTLARLSGRKLERV